MNRKTLLTLLVCAAPLFTTGCDALFSETPAPDIAGDWTVDYEDNLEVRITIGGVVYEETIGAQGGAIEITHDGQPITFDLDCGKEEIVCPSEAWPGDVGIEQRNEQFPHQFTLLLPGQRCDGEEVAPNPDECGEGTDNPDCDDVCMGEIVTEDVERLGVIDEPGETMEVLLGAGVATNGVNCAMLGVSITRADLNTRGGPDRANWVVTDMENGEVVIGYSGGCLWAGDPDMDGDLEALVIGAGIELTTHYSATRADD